MSKADEMLKRLGYSPIRNNTTEEMYEDEYINYINFQKEEKLIICNCCIGMQELQAINEKCRELEK